jgi:sulfide:quinone oxidoreductase
MADPVVCVVGGGTAGLEAVLAARAQLGEGVELVLIAPEPEFRYRPMSHRSLFAPTPEQSLAIADLAAHTRTSWVQDRADALREPEREVLTRDGETIAFDFLLLALGARPRRALRAGHVWVRSGDPGFLDEILAGLATGAVRSVAVVVPRGARWPIPAYELALVLAWSAAGGNASVTLLTAERQPLDTLGSTATEVVCAELEAAGIEVVTGVEVVDRDTGELDSAALAEHDAAAAAEVNVVPEWGGDGIDPLTARPSAPDHLGPVAKRTRRFDRLISLPTVLGPFLPGSPHDAAGFVEVTETLNVMGSRRVWAAGGCVAAALEHSALSAQHADGAVAGIARAAGVGSAGDLVVAPELTGMLLTGQRDEWLASNPPSTPQPSTRCLWWPPGRAVGKMLAKLIAAWDPSVDGELPGHPHGVVVRAPVALGRGDGFFVSRAAVGGEAELRRARVRDLEIRQLMAIRRREREAEEQLRTMRGELRSFDDRERAVIRDLRGQGYLQRRGRS